MENSVDIFISYAHGDESSPEGKKRQEVLNLIQEAAEKKPFINKLYIDINAINFKDNIQAFAKEIAKAQFIIIILSDKYLKSQWCMQEVSLILESPDFQDRIFPVVLEDAKVNSAEGRAEYTIYWQDKVDKLDEQIKRIRDITQCAPLIEDLKVYKSILKAVSTFTNTIGLMKVLNAESHMKTSFESLFEAIGEQQKTLRSKIDLVKVSEENAELKKKIAEIEKQYAKLKDETEKNYTKKYEADIVKTKKNSEKLVAEIDKLKEEKKNLKEQISEFEKKEKELEAIRVKREQEESALRTKKEEEDKLTNEPYHVLDLNKGASAAEIERQYQKLYSEYNQGYESTGGNTKKAYKEELDKLEKAYSKVYGKVKEVEEGALKTAYDFLQVKPDASSREIKEKFEKQKVNLQNGMKSANKKIAESAESDLKELEVHYKLVYNLVRKKEKETAPPNMVLVNGGKFKMGEGPTSRGNTLHEVELESFFMDKYPLLVKEYREFCEDVNYKMPPPPPWGWKDDHPMVNINWYEALKYALWADKRLPTEAEWEFAARGGILSKQYEFSGSNNLDEVGWYSKNAGGSTKPVRDVKPNELGIYEMSGQVREWCWDWYDENYYKSSPPANPRGPDKGRGKVLRGGSFKVAENYCKVFSRSSGVPFDRNEAWGVRFVRDCL